MFEQTGDQEQRNGQGTSTALLDRMSQEVASLLGESAAQDMTAIVGANTEFEGILHYNGTIRIDGKVEGEIHTDGVLLIGKEAIINARIRARTIVSCGRIAGDVIATEKIALLAPACLKGSVKTPLLSMEEGVHFKGSLDVTETDEEVSTIDSLPAMKAVAGAN
jgi:cytoskeletal protein CcmA (bactofilin family)